MQSFKDLKVWQKAHAVTLTIYKLTATFPREELFGLTSQMRRAAASIGANIAEGCGRRGNALARFLQIAMGSASELEYHVLLAHDLSFINDQSYIQLDDEITQVKRMLIGFIQKTSA